MTSRGESDSGGNGMRTVTVTQTESSPGVTVVGQPPTSGQPEPRPSRAADVVSA